MGLAAVVHSDQMTFSASIERNEVFLREQFTYMIELNNASNFPQVHWPKMEAFTVAGRPSQSSNYSIVNGRTSSTKSLAFTLIAMKTGDVKIPSIPFSVDGKNYVTKPIDITVYERGATSKKGTKAINQNHLALRAIPSKTNLIMGESVVVDYVIETTKDIRSPFLESEPKPTGFLYEQRDDKDMGVWRNEIRDGIRIKKATIMRMVYTPTQGGALTLDPLEIGLQVLTQQQTRRSNSLFNNSLFSNNWRRMTLSSDKLVFHVINPPEPRPDSFEGAVGEFAIRHTISTQSIAKGESISYKIRISGSGNFKQFQFPELKLDPNKFDVFEPEKKDAFQFVKDTYTGYREYVWLIVPRKEGELTIPQLYWSFINARTEQYVTKKIPAAKIIVTAKDDSTALYSAGYRREEIQKLNDDIRFIQSSTHFWHKKGHAIYVSIPYLSLWIIGLIGIFGSFGAKRYRMHIDANPISRRKKQTYSKAKSLLNKINKNEDYDIQTSKIHSILLDYLGDIFNVSSQSLEFDAMIQIAVERKMPENNIQLVSDFIRTLNAGRFAPNGFSGDVSKLYDETYAILDMLEKGKIS